MKILKVGPMESWATSLKEEAKSALNKPWLTLQDFSCYFENWDKIKNGAEFIR